MARTALLAFAIFVGLGAVSFIGGTVLPASSGLRYGFPAYYTSSRLVLEREWGPDVYDNAWFSDRSKDLTGGTVAEIYRPNTPMMSLLALPIAWLDIFKARRVWLLADLLLIVATVVALFAALPALRSPLRAAVLIGLCLWWAPLRETVSLGQAYALMLALQAVALWAVVRDRRGLTGLSVGAAVATKLAAVPLLLVLAVRGSWRSVVVAGATVLGLAAATVGFAHVDSWSRFGQVLVEDVLRPPASQSVTAYQSASSFFAHLFTADAVWNPASDRGAAVAGDDPWRHRHRDRPRGDGLARSARACRHRRRRRGRGRRAGARPGAGVPLRDAARPGRGRPRPMVRRAGPAGPGRPVAGGRVSLSWPRRCRTRIRA